MLINWNIMKNIIVQSWDLPFIRIYGKDNVKIIIVTRKTKHHFCNFLSLFVKLWALR